MQQLTWTNRGGRLVFAVLLERLVKREKNELKRRLGGRPGPSLLFSIRLCILLL
jgi:hypothetical protein